MGISFGNIIDISIPTKNILFILIVDYIGQKSNIKEYRKLYIKLYLL